MKVCGLSDYGEGRIILIFLFCKTLQTNWTPLHFVVNDREGDMELVKMLLEHGAETNLGDSVC